MPDHPKPIRERIDEFLDDVMSADDRRAFEDELANDPELQDLVDFQCRIDQSLRAFTVPPQLTAVRTAGAIPPYGTSSPRLERSSRRLVLPSLALAVTALVICGVFVWQADMRRKVEPYFRPESLASIYDDMVERGFKPYYECRDPERFAATFKTRQSRPLQLAEMPDGTRMLGLSYPGGLSRNTTAMLCEVDSMPVVVFVDRIESDAASVVQQAEGRELSIFRKELNGLVLYEVTPLATDRVMNLLVPSAH